MGFSRSDLVWDVRIFDAGRLVRMMQLGGRGLLKELLQPMTNTVDDSEELICCGFRGKAVRIPRSIRSAFRNEADHDSGMNPITDSDFKPITLGWLSER